MEEEQDLIFEEQEGKEVTIGEMKQEYDSDEGILELMFGGNGDHCTYDGGYLPRQPVFVCVTCTPDGNAGICSACSLTCHSGHKLKDLWTKRNFRCDCGNSKFSSRGGFQCKLKPSKDSVNSENRYNHNYQGLYCTCKRPYPDPDTTDDENMLQCCICEDWFHEKHLGLLPTQSVPLDEAGENLFEDLICADCASTKCSFLSHCPHLFLPPTTENNEEIIQPSSDPPKSGLLMSHDSNSRVHHANATVEDDTEIATNSALSNITKTDCDGCTEKGLPIPNDSSSNSQPSANGMAEKVEIGIVGALSPSVKVSDEENSLSNVACLLKVPETTNVGDKDVDSSQNKTKSSDVLPTHALFMAFEWRNKLCRCGDCLKKYAQLGVSFLLDPTDTIRHYEEKVEQRKKEEGPISNKILNKNFDKFNHVQKLEFTHKYAEFKFEIGNYLSSIVETGRAISKEDIDAFFNTKAKKRRLA